MNIYLLDIPTDDGWSQRRLEKKAREEQEVKSLQENVSQLQSQFHAKMAELDQREAEVMHKEQLLKDFAPKEFKKYQQRLQEKKQTSMNNNDDNTINLATTAAGNTTATVAVNNTVPETETKTSSIGSFVMICTALFLCGTSALFYGKKANK